MTRVYWLGATLIASGAALAGPPYISDDPEPTDFRHYEIYLFTEGISTADGSGGSSGIDFNYGATADLQLTAVLPIAYEPGATGLGNAELAAKYRFLHQSQDGWDIAVFPRLFLPRGSTQVGERHASLLIPMWLERDWERWATFGGGGCAIDHGAESQDYCIAGWALARQVSSALQIGAELVYQTSPVRGERAATGIGGGLQYDLSKVYHALAYFGPGLQNRDATDRYSWYASLLLTF